MNPHADPREVRRRRQLSRNAAQQRRIFFDSVRTSTVNLVPVYPLPPLPRRVSRQTSIEIDDPRMTRLLQVAIVGVMLVTLLAFRGPLWAAVGSLFS